MARQDLLRLVEAAYTSTEDPRRWVDAIVEGARGLDRGRGLALIEGGIDRGVVRLDGIHGTAGPDYERFVRSACGSPEFARMATSLCNFQRSGRSRSSLTPRLDPHLKPALDGVVFGVDDDIGLVCTTERDDFCVLVVPTAPVDVPAPLVRLYRLLGIHVAAGRRLTRAATPDEAILEPDGRVVHAEGSARFARQHLRDRAIGIDRARTMKGRRDLEDALKVWQGLVDGRWSLVERTESDGRRLLIARRNAPPVRGLLRLTAREETVARLLAMGQTQKLVGYTLGISAPTVNTHVQRLLAKLGFASVSQLMSSLDGLAPPIELPRGR